MAIIFQSRLQLAGLQPELKFMTAQNLGLEAQPNGPAATGHSLASGSCWKKIYIWKIRYHRTDSLIINESAIQIIFRVPNGASIQPLGHGQTQVKKRGKKLKMFGIEISCCKSSLGNIVKCQTLHVSVWCGQSGNLESTEKCHYVIDIILNISKTS